MPPWKPAEGDLVRVAGSGFCVVTEIGLYYIHITNISRAVGAMSGQVAQREHILRAIWTFHGPVQCPAR